MNLNIAGIDHQTAPIAVREQAMLKPCDLCDELGSLCPQIRQAAILSTCNRIEIYMVTNGQDAENAGAAKQSLKKILGLPEQKSPDYVYTFSNREAAEHLYRVVCGLESMVIGEYEVLGQVRQALDIAEKAGTMALPLRRVFEGAIRTGRLVREQTGISRNAMSVSSAAVELAAEITGDLKKCTMLVIGAGDAGRLVARVAREKQVLQIVVASRTRERALALAAELNGVPSDLSRLDSDLSRADIVVTCAGAPHRLLDVERIKKAMTGRQQPLVIVDIAVPRNVAPEVANIPDVYLYNLDDLNGFTFLNRRRREQEIEKAERLIAAELSRFERWWHDLQVRPVVGSLMSRAERIRIAQLSKTLKKLPPLSDQQKNDLEAMTRAIVTRILKDPIEYLQKNEDSHGTEMVTELFKLNGEERR